MQIEICILGSLYHLWFDKNKTKENPNNALWSGNYCSGNSPVGEVSVGVSIAEVSVEVCPREVSVGELSG